MKIKLTILSIILILTLTSCAYNTSLINTSYKALSISETSYDTTMSIARDLDSRGLLPLKDKAKIIKYGTTFSKAHNAAVEALAKYSETKDLSDSETLESQMSIASEALSNLLLIIKPYLKE